MAEVGFGPPLPSMSVLLADFMSLVKYYFDVDGAPVRCLAVAQPLFTPRPYEGLAVRRVAWSTTGGGSTRSWPVYGCHETEHKSACATKAHLAHYGSRGEVTAGGDCGCIIPCAATNSRAGPRMEGHLRAKTIPPARLARPPSATVTGAPIRSASVPATSEPIGVIPRNIIEYSDITRPRSWSGTMA